METHARSVRRSALRFWVFVLVGGLSFLLLLTVYNGYTETEAKERDERLAESRRVVREWDERFSEIDAKIEAARREEESLTRWRSNQDTDDVSGKSWPVATVRSKNTVNLPFPWGPTTANIHVRRHPRFNSNVFIVVSSGTLTCRGGEAFRTCNIPVRFDDGKLSNYRVSGNTADGSMDTLFIRNESRFVGELRKAKTMTLAVIFHDEGERTFTFNVSDFPYESLYGKKKK
jgi:hypothetical protein